MSQEPNLLSELNAALPDLNKSETKVADAILEDPEAATRSSIAVLAAAANVSEPSVNRFCKRFGATGFPDFKLRLARSLVWGCGTSAAPLKWAMILRRIPGSFLITPSRL